MDYGDIFWNNVQWPEAWGDLRGGGVLKNGLLPGLRKKTTVCLWSFIRVSILW
jgi:hypothetical protein